jgi:hypothetical protein
MNSDRMMNLLEAKSRMKRAVAKAIKSAGNHREAAINRVVMLGMSDTKMHEAVSYLICYAIGEQVLAERPELEGDVKALEEEVRRRLRHPDVLKHLDQLDLGLD